MTGWREWTRGTRVRNTVTGRKGLVVRVVARGQGNDKVKVRWDRGGYEGWSSAALLERVAVDLAELRVGDVVRARGMGNCLFATFRLDRAPLRLAGSGNWMLYGYKGCGGFTARVIRPGVDDVAMVAD